MLSMYDNPEYVQRALQAGASGYVLKDAGQRDRQRHPHRGRGRRLPQPRGRAGCFEIKRRPLLSPRESQILRPGVACRASRWPASWT
jgi:DNA-binding NarL/FixJ family response regulator